MSYPESGDFTSAVTEELMLIGYLCGYVETPNSLNIYGLMKKCVSLGPYGWGLALMALIVTLSGGNLPFHAVLPIPHGALGRIKNMCVIEDRRLLKEGLIEAEGYFTSVARHIDSAIRKEVYVPNTFAVCLEYVDAQGKNNVRCFMVRMTMHESYPFMAVIPPDHVTEKLIELCRKGRTELTGDEYREFMMTHGQDLKETKEEGKVTLEDMLEGSEEEYVEEEEEVEETEDLEDIDVGDIN